MHKVSRAFLISAIFLFVLLATATAAPAQRFKTIYDFDSSRQPVGGLIQATDGNLYGTTVGGGANSYGTVFRITLSGALTTLYSFCSQQPDCSDGSEPLAPVIQGSDGSFYGTTSSGGTDYYGTVFSITPSGTLTILHRFSGYTDGAGPYAGLIQATDGNFYGTTLVGGTYWGGTVFRITPEGTLETLYNFCPQPPECPDGAYPYSGLVQGPDGALYGTTAEGGAYANNGTVFKITLRGALTTLHSFDSIDGTYPWGSLIEATYGNFYGVTSRGGNSDACSEGCGTLFEVTPSGTFRTLYRFDLTDGDDPWPALIRATNGDLYGTTLEGGTGTGCAFGCGTAFRISRKGRLTTLYNFCSLSGCADGNAPQGVLQDTNGSLYGTTGGGGLGFYSGTAFRLSEGLGGPFVETQTTAGKVGSAVNILGTDLTGATSVTFNGTTATFTVASPSLITTTVPAGATTGTVQVVTPGGALSSNAPFRVVQ